MNSLKQFLGVIKVAGDPLPEQHKAFYMDGGKGVREKPDMRAHAGLGSCQCCDYFLPNDEDGSILFIEETRLLDTKRNLEGEFSYLNEKDKKKFVRTKLFQEQHLKVYGAMLVLCRLAVKHSDIKDMIDGKKYFLWLVVSKMDVDDMRYFDKFSRELCDQLKSVLTSELLEDVQVLPAYKLEEKLNNAPAP